MKHILPAAQAGSTDRQEGRDPVPSPRDPPFGSRTAFAELAGQGARRSTSRSTTLALVGVVAVGLLDRTVGTEVGLALFYLIPIGACGWWVGRAPAILVALTATGSWIAADLAQNNNVLTTPTVWNGFTRVIIFLFAGIVLAELRSDRRKLEQMVETASQLAMTDALTGVSNSRAFLAELHRALAGADRSMRSVAVAYIDLDNFKKVNDHYGHAHGDFLLRETTRSLLRSVRGGDLVARLGGDEFAVLFDDPDPAAVEAAARRIVERITAMGTSYPEANLSASVGIAILEPDAGTPEDLLRRADDAMYRAKREGKRRVARG